MPELIRVLYPVEHSTFPQPSLISALNMLAANYNLMTDPYVIDLLKKQNEGQNVSHQIQKVFLTGRTFCSDEIRSLSVKAKATFDELGSSPADWYIQACIDRFSDTMHGVDQLSEWSFHEKRHLANVLRGLPKDALSIESDIHFDTVTRKVQMLVDLLVETAMAKPSFTGIVFIEQRIWVAALANILSKHPRTRDLFRFGTFVGTSKSTKQKGTVASAIEPQNQQSTLDDFRAGKINLILATSVLEEGIDISSCHLVIDFERPKNLKSFVQRRGRARMQESRYIMFLPEVNAGKAPEAWHSLEKEMKAAYMDDMRKLQGADQEESDNEVSQRYFRVTSTG